MWSAIFATAVKKEMLHIVVALSLLAACGEPDCVDKTGEYVGIAFYDLEDNVAASIRVNLLQVAGSTDTLVYQLEDVAGVLLPINPTSDEITAYFDTEYGNDTLTIQYNTVSRLISEDCGFEVIYNDLTIIRNDFDTATVRNSTVQVNFLNPTTFNENIRVYN